MVIGGLWLPTSERDEFKPEIHQLRDRHRIGGEFKWQKVSPSREAFYRQLVEWFQGKGEQLRFRCIAVDHTQVDLKLYHEDDQELGFYKFYYQLLHHWILDFNHYSVFVDFKSNRRRDRCMCCAGAWTIPICPPKYTTFRQCVPRNQCLFSWPMCSPAWPRTGSMTGYAKAVPKPGSCSITKTCTAVALRHTFKGEQKFNVFRIDLAGGW